MSTSRAGAELFYSVRGDEPACVVLCSTGTRSMEMLTETLSRHSALVYVDLRGSGRSTGDAADVDFDVMADDLEAVCDHAGIGQASVFGYSIHGIPAIECAKRRPERFSHVIVAGTPPRGNMEWLSAEATRFFEEDASDERKRVLRENVGRLPPGAPLPDALAAQAPLRFFDPYFDYVPFVSALDGSSDLVQRLLGPLTSSWDAAEHAATLAVPLFIAHGRYDYVVPYRLWGPYVGALPNATFRLFERSGHQPFFEEPAEFVQSLQAWMGGARPA